MTAEPRFEPPPGAPPGLRRVLRDLGPQYAVNGLIGLIFAATGPIAVILAAGVQGGLGGRELASWLFGVFFLNGLLTVLTCWLYRQPLAFFWTIPGTVLVGQALGHMSFAEVVGAYLATGVLMLVLGLSGWVRTAMAAVPMPIVMGMVAGVFLGFGTGLVDSVVGDGAVAVPMILAFVLLSAWPAAGRRLPPVLGALLVGVAAVLISGHRGSGGGDLTGVLAAPLFVAPAWSWQAMLELVVPLAVTVLVVQNGQGVAVLRAAGHRAPVNVVTVACGLWSVLAAGVGAVSTCLTGPTNALLTPGAPVHRGHHVRDPGDGVRAVRAGGGAADAGRAACVPGDPRRPGDAEGAAVVVRGRVRWPRHAGRAGHVRGHGVGGDRVQHRRPVLGAGRRCRDGVAAGARRPRPGSCG
ncbi:benzoate membrane transport protein [Pseudonocardia parietis]|uniref:Benzoate membrane transport protein n=1 Tax=Pseudonocardia parietis TaxID=570936 RepID=A0ABS4VRN5_9PSEU|nr:benzoate membrane transport protein [Pseudonocardia parietis]